MIIGITGATGFIGSHLINKLIKKKIEYFVFDRKKHNLFNKNSLKNFVSGKDLIIHLAGINKDGLESEMSKTNILGTKYLMEAILKYSPNAKLVFASSSLVYAENNIFGVGKKKAEEIIEYYSKKHKIKAIILRFSNVYGPGCKPYRNSAIATFIYKIFKGEVLLIEGDGGQVKDFLYIDDAIRALIKCIKFVPKDVEYFDICTGRLTSINTLILYFKKILKKDISVKYVENKFINKKNKLKSYKKAEKILSWVPRVKVEKGLRLIINSYSL